MSVAAIILAGGRARRLGMPKHSVVVGAETLLERAIRAVRPMPTVIVGPPESIVDTGAAGPAFVVRESPPFAGPAAAIAAGLYELDRRAVPADRIVLLACDLPRAPEAVALLRAHPVLDDGVVLRDGSGRLQWLCGIYRATAVRTECSRIRETSGLCSAPVRVLFERLRLTPLDDHDELALDIDTPADLAAARERMPA